MTYKAISETKHLIWSLMAKYHLTQDQAIAMLAVSMSKYLTSN